ncbi:MAG TPA: hypothetical protein HPP87_04050 [Planctomycetes bacterium]|nr:hypothetical protein [Planctomycetota bacterium]
MDAVIYLIAGPLFLISLVAHLYVKLRLRPRQGSDFDDYYHEFEGRHPDFARYEKWSQITFVTAVIAALLLFVATAI